jgi:spermidine/putrescine transport system permease protein
MVPLTRVFLYCFIAVWIALAIVPVASLVVWPFLGFEDFHFTLSPSLQAITSVFDSGRWYVTLRTLRIAATVTMIEIFVAVPFALWLARGVRSASFKAFVVALLTVPFFLSLASRTIVWRSVLGNAGLVNAVLLHLGLIDQPIDWLLYSEFAVHLGLIGPSFPTMVLPIYMSISLIDNEILEAGPDLGANPLHVFTDIVLPLIAPGIVAGIIFTFVPMLGETVVPTLLGGGQVSMLGASITSLLGVLNYPAAAALGLVVLAILVVLLAVLQATSGREASLGRIFEGLKR